MRSAWNSAKEVSWRKIEDNLFTIQFTCLGDWNKAMFQGPWFFRNQALIIEEYDGFANPRTVVLDKITVWAQVWKLPDLCLKEPIIKGMCRSMGEVLEVQIKLPTGFVGPFVRIRVKLHIDKKLIRFVPLTKDKKKEWYQIKYEKLPTFCFQCGLIGHWHEECGAGEHDPSKFEWGDFILADSVRGLNRGRGSGRGFEPGRGGGRGSEFGRAPFMGRGRGREGVNSTLDITKPRADDEKGRSEDTDMEVDWLRKRRVNSDGQNSNPNVLAITGNTTTVANMVGIFDGEAEKGSVEGTPGKVQVQKRSRTDEVTNSNTNLISAVSTKEAVREQ
jgi:hypothetical protein